MRPAVLLLILFLFSVSSWNVAYAQGTDSLDPWSVSDQELLSYLRAEERIYDMKVRARMRAERFSEKLGMSLERYYEIAKSVGDTMSRTPYTQQELETAKQISAKIRQINRELPKQSESIMHQEGFSPERYHRLDAAIGSSYVLRSRIEKLREFFSL